MKVIIVSAAVVLLLCLAVGAAPPKEPTSNGNLISISLDDVALIDMIRMMNRITDASFAFDPSDPNLNKRITIDIRDKPWKPPFRAALIQHGLVLIEDTPGSNSYSIVPAKSKAVATRRAAAKEAVATIDAVLTQLDKGNAAKAKELLSQYRDHNARILKDTTEKK
jgi:hypothetical protein